MVESYDLYCFVPEFPTSEAKYGAIDSGRLVIKGRVRPATLQKNTKSMTSWELHHGCNAKLVQRVYPDAIEREFETSQVAAVPVFYTPMQR